MFSLIKTTDSKKPTAWYFIKVMKIKKNMFFFRDGVVSSLEMTSKAELAFKVNLLKYMNFKI